PAECEPDPLAGVVAADPFALLGERTLVQLQLRLVLPLIFFIRIHHPPSPHSAASYSRSRSASPTGRGLKRAVHCWLASSANSGRISRLTPHSASPVGSPANRASAATRRASASAPSPSPASPASSAYSGPTAAAFKRSTCGSMTPIATPCVTP